MSLKRAPTRPHLSHDLELSLAKLLLTISKAERSIEHQRQKLA